MLAEDLRLRLARFQRGNTDNSVLVVLRSSELQVEREYKGHEEVSKRSAAKRAADGDLIKFRGLLSRGVRIEVYVYPYQRSSRIL